ncbi:MAG: MerR family transcriptional regulator [Ruminococcus sp.]|nr:MerR family transcriptional regulator [Ruminococcus sp.]
MSKFTTGEIAKLCGVSVRTVQYYDSRGILKPSELSEGGRRLYSHQDVELMKVICFLRELGLPIKSIGELIAEEHPEDVISILLDEQEKLLSAEIGEKQSQLDKIRELRKTLKTVEQFSVGTIGDVAHIMENKKKLRKNRAILIIVGIIMDIIEVGTLIWGILKGVWWPFAVGMCIVIAAGVGISYFYFKNTAYICPKCHKVFRPKFKEAFFAMHTPKTRKLTCPECGHKGYCVETCVDDITEN